MNDIIKLLGVKRNKGLCTRCICQATVVCYVNSPAEVKADSDVCCTSANAVMVIGGLDSEEVLEVTNRLSSSFIIRTTPLRSSPVIFLISSLPLTNPSEERKPIAKYYIVHRRFQEFFSWSSEKPLPVPTTMRYFYYTVEGVVFLR